MAIDEGFTQDDPELAQMITDHIADDRKDAEKTEETEEENKEDTTEKVEEDKKDVLSNTEEEKTETQEKEEEKTETTDDELSLLNRVLGTEYESLDQVKSVIESNNELESIRKSLTEKEQEIQEKDNLLNTKTDGLKLFANENLYKVNEIIKNNEDLNVAGILKLASANLDEMNDLDVLKLQREIKRNDSNISSADIEHAINKKYGLTVDPNELEGEELRDFNANKILRKDDADDARKELKSLMNVDVPEKIDLLAMKNKEQEDAENAYKAKLDTWTKKSDVVIKSLDKFSLEYDKGEDGKFEFNYDDKFKDYLSKNLPEYAARAGLDAGKEEDLGKLVNIIKNDFVNRNLPQMFKNFKQELFTKFQDAEYKKKHNIKDPEVKEAPDKISDEDKKNNEVDKQVLDSLNNW
jgi:hypothetical protein